MSSLRHVLITAGVCLLLAAVPFVGTNLPAFAAMSGPKARDSAQMALESLKEWAGKYPFDKIKGQTFWEQEPLLKSLQIVLGPTRLDILQRQWLSGPTDLVQVQENVLHAQICKAHACNTDYMHLFINYTTGEIAACWSESDASGQSKSDVWLSSLQKSPSISTDGCDKYQGFDLYKKYGDHS